MGEGVPPKTMWVDRDEMLQAMAFSANVEAQDRLSDEGKEALRAIRYTEQYTSMDLIEVFIESSAYDALSEYEQETINVYLARKTLIDAFKTFGEEEEE